jgi:hypothetical protein
MSMQSKPGIDPNVADDAIEGADESMDPEIVDAEEHMLEHDGTNCCSKLPEHHRCCASAAKRANTLCG